jgi:hypothetical protein
MFTVKKIVLTVEQPGHAIFVHFSCLLIMGPNGKDLTYDRGQAEEKARKLAN